MPRQPFNPYLEAALLQQQAGDIALDKMSDHEQEELQHTISPLDFPFELGSLLVGVGKQAINKSMWGRIRGAIGNANDAVIMKDARYLGVGRHPQEGAPRGHLADLVVGQSKAGKGVDPRLLDAARFEGERVQTVLDAATEQGYRNTPWMRPGTTDAEMQMYFKSPAWAERDKTTLNRVIESIKREKDAELRRDSFKMLENTDPIINRSKLEKIPLSEEPGFKIIKGKRNPYTIIKGKKDD